MCLNAYVYLHIYECVRFWRSFDKMASEEDSSSNIRVKGTLVSELKINDLKSELKKRGLANVGTRQQMVERLQAVCMQFRLGFAAIFNLLPKQQTLQKMPRKARKSHKNVEKTKI